LAGKKTVPTLEAACRIQYREETALFFDLLEEFLFGKHQPAAPPASTGFGAAVGYVTVLVNVF
jgi:hypothetical protein